MNRARTILCAGALVLMSAGFSFAAEPVNILLITADDLHYDSLGATGCPLPGLSPNLDDLASRGLLFQNAHVTVSVCQPCRSTILTGRYPHRNGARGFEPILPDVPTLSGTLQQAGYHNGIFGKVEHLRPQSQFHWDYVAQQKDLGSGRNPEAYGEHTRRFLAETKKVRKPFFLMVNSHDPHRPFGSTKAEDDLAARMQGEFPTPKVPLAFDPKDVPIPGFFEDLPEIRQDLAEYYTSIQRMDQTVGKVLQALEDAGLRESTLILFLSDNAMPFPYAKANCYQFSTRTPLIIVWPGKIEPARTDADHLVATIDFMPTLLDAVGVAHPHGMDGRSFLPLLKGDTMEGFDSVFTVFEETSAKDEFPMRALHDKRYGYIFNAWSDGTTKYLSGSSKTPTGAALASFDRDHPDLPPRCLQYELRSVAEFYDYERDPYARKNLIDDPAHAARIAEYRGRMREWMAATEDPLAAAFAEKVKQPISDWSNTR